MKHTAGPWTDVRVYKDFEDTPYCFKVYGNKGKTTVHFQKVNGMESEALANAQLIAAAPVLLGACKYAMQNLRPQGNVKKDFSGHLAIAELSRAIFKAEAK